MVLRSNQKAATLGPLKIKLTELRNPNKNYLIIMPILPSTLEYSKESLETKICYIQDHRSRFKALTNQSIFEMHIDLVYPEFAKSRSVMSSLDLETNLNSMIKLIDNKCLLTIHFMGELDDISNFSKSLNKYTHLTNNLEIYIPYNLSIESFPKGFKYYFWHDKDQLNLKIKSKKVLLLTVKAGISGQKRLDQDKKIALEVVAKLGNKNVIVDGGWSTKDLEIGLRMVSYSSFWSEFMNEI